MIVTIDYGLFLLYIYIHGRFGLFYINFLTCFIICFISFRTCSKSTKSMKPKRNISTKWATILYFVQEKALFYTKVKAFLLQQHFRKYFSNFRSNRPNNATVCKTPMLKKYSNALRNYYVVWRFIETRFSQLPRYFHVFQRIQFIQRNAISLSSDVV